MSPYLAIFIGLLICVAVTGAVVSVDHVLYSLAIGDLDLEDV